jgi:hypothetical protein
VQGCGSGEVPDTAEGIRTNIERLVRHLGWDERYRARRKPRLLIAEGHFGRAFENEQNLLGLGTTDMTANPLVRFAHYVEDLVLALPSREESAIALLDAISGSS